MATLQSSLVNRLVTKTQDMHGRAIKNAADAVDPQDYVTLSQLNQAKADLSFPINPLEVNSLTIDNTTQGGVLIGQGDKPIKSIVGNYGAPLITGGGTADPFFGMIKPSADATADLTLATGFQDIPGASAGIMSIVMSFIGTYIITVDLKVNYDDLAGGVVAQLVVGGVPDTDHALTSAVSITAGGGHFSQTQMLSKTLFVPSTGVGAIVKVQAQKVFNFGTALIFGSTHSSGIRALFIG